MRSIATVLFAFLVVAPTAALAQHDADVQAVQELEHCIAEHHTHLSRIVRLIEEARGRTSSSDEAVRHDAELSIETLMERAVEARERLRECVARAHFEAPSHETVEHVTTPDHAADSVASSGGSIHEVESDAAVSQHVRVVRGERVDGAGSASDAAVRTAVHGLGPSIGTCYDDYVDRASSRRGHVHLSFTVEDGGRVSGASVERADFDSQLRQCVQRAASTMRVAGARGRSVYAYEIALGE